MSLPSVRVGLIQVWNRVQALKPCLLDVSHSEVGVGELHARMPYPDLHAFDQDRRLTAVPDLFTVSLVTRYVEGKLGQAQDGAPLAQGLHRLQPAQREGLARADPVVVDERIGRRP